MWETRKGLAYIFVCCWAGGVVLHHGRGHCQPSVCPPLDLRALQQHRDVWASASTVSNKLVPAQCWWLIARGTSPGYWLSVACPDFLLVLMHTGHTPRPVRLSHVTHPCTLCTGGEGSLRWRLYMMQGMGTMQPLRAFGSLTLTAIMSLAMVNKSTLIL